MGRLQVVLGRLCFALIFIIASFGHFSQGTIDYAQSHGVPMAGLLVPLSGIMALLGGVSIALGFYARAGGWLIVLFLLPVTFTMHNFWAVTDPAQHQLQQIMFLKNISMLGGALLIAHFGGGPCSVDLSSKGK